MKIIAKISLVLVALTLLSMKGNKEAYRFFDAKGSQVKYKAMFKKMVDADVILFGELHNNPISHWMQLELTEDLFVEKQKDLVLGAEMFEADNQLLMDEYLKDLIKQSSFEKEARIWSNYETDYKPLVEFAKENSLDFIATNIPRRYASVVHKQGFEGLESLSEEAKGYVAPLPVNYDPELKGYKSMLEMMGGMGGGHVNENLPKAQAIKDATMAHFILENWSEGKTFIHYNGTYHSNDYEGIVWYLKQAYPTLNIITIASVEQDTIAKLTDESIGIADYILCVPSNMTKTY